METAEIAIGILILIRITALGSERLAFHGLGQSGYGVLPTMGIAFWGATAVLWVAAVTRDQAWWIGSTMWTGAIYALAFGLYTASLAEGPVGSVSAWANATVVLLWLVHPTGGLVSVLGMVLFVFGAWFLTRRHMTRPVIWMLLSDLLFVVARSVDAAHAHLPTFAYAASLFTSISLWMTVVIVAGEKTKSVLYLFWSRPGWSIAAAVTNAGAYLALFALLYWLPPAIVESVSALAGFAATIAGVLFFHEAEARRKVGASSLMTLGVILLLYDHLQLLNWL